MPLSAIHAHRFCWPTQIMLFFGVHSYSARPYSNCEKHSLALALETMVIVKAFHPTQHAVQRLLRKTLVNHEYSNILVVLERGKQQT